MYCNKQYFAFLRFPKPPTPQGAPAEAKGLVLTVAAIACVEMVTRPAKVRRPGLLGLLHSELDDETYPAFAICYSLSCQSLVLPFSFESKPSL